MFKRIVRTIIEIHQKLFPVRKIILGSIGLQDQCKFIPTCSQYALQAVEKYGGIKGLYLGTKRFLRCHPFSAGGLDPVP